MAIRNIVKKGDEILRKKCKPVTEFNEKLYAAGLQDIIDAKQSQLDAWLANQ